MIGLEDSILFADAVVFGLRMNSGIDLDEIGLRFPEAGNSRAIRSLLERLKFVGLVQLDGSHAELTHAGRLVCDSIGSAVLEAEFET